MEALSSFKTQPKTKAKSGSEEDTKMKKKKWKQRNQIREEMTQRKEATPPISIAINKADITLFDIVQTLITASGKNLMSALEGLMGKH